MTEEDGFPFKDFGNDGREKLAPLPRRELLSHPPPRRFSPIPPLSHSIFISLAVPPQNGETKSLFLHKQSQ